MVLLSLWVIGLAVGALQQESHNILVRLSHWAIGPERAIGLIAIISLWVINRLLYLLQETRNILQLLL